MNLNISLIQNLNLFKYIMEPLFIIYELKPFFIRGNLLPIHFIAALVDPIKFHLIMIHFLSLFELTYFISIEVFFPIL